jgi:hypothetical protein
MQDDVENVVAAVVKAALNGDMAAAKIILDRVGPARRLALSSCPWLSVGPMRLRLTQQFSMRLPMVL